MSHDIDWHQIPYMEVTQFDYWLRSTATLPTLICRRAETEARRDEIREWVAIECPSAREEWFGFTFTDDADAVKFKLRWC